MIGLWIRRAVCDEFTHGLKSSMRGNNGLAPRFSASFGRPNGIVKLLVFYSLAPFTPYKQIVELFFDECRQKILNRNCLAVRIAARIAQLAPAERKPAALSSRKLHILIVEDHENTATVMSKLLKRNGHEVVTASTVRQALHVLRTTPLDLLVSDLGLPDGNGFEVMTELSKISDAKGLPLAVMGWRKMWSEAVAPAFPRT